MYPIPDEVSSLATNVVIFKVRLLCGKGSVQTAHLLYEKGGGLLAPSTSKQEHFFNRALFVLPVLVQPRLALFLYTPRDSGPYFRPLGPAAPASVTPELGQSPAPQSPALPGHRPHQEGSSCRPTF